MRLSITEHCMVYNIDWEGAYDAWKKSGLPRRRFLYSKLFEEFIIDGTRPSEDTVRTRFRSIRDQRGDYEDQHAAKKTEALDAECGDAVRIVRVDVDTSKISCDETQTRKVKSRRQYHQVIIHWHDGRSIEFYSRNAEQFVMQFLCGREAS